jgi:hypothetical protein
VGQNWGPRALPDAVCLQQKKVRHWYAISNSKMGNCRKLDFLK